MKRNLKTTVAVTLAAGFGWLLTSWIAAYVLRDCASWLVPFCG